MESSPTPASGHSQKYGILARHVMDSVVGEGQHSTQITPL